MPALYNEIDPFAASWLEGLIDDGRIAAGVVNRTTIKKLTTVDVAAATQAHFFAGIGGWSYALRLAGWPDDVPVWTGSPPCQPFSTAGRRRGKADERHLWPAFYDLIRKCRPPVLLGEQVASPDGLDWLDVVLSDLERAGYTVGAVDLCAAGFGAPHLRQRLYFVAVADGQRLERVRLQLRGRRPREDQPQVDRGGSSGVVADAERGRSGEVGPGEEGGRGEEQPDRLGQASVVADSDEVGRGTGQPRGNAARRQPDEPRSGQAGVVGDALRGGGPGDDRGLLGAQTRGGRQVGPEPPGAAGVLGDAGGQGSQVGSWQTDGRGAVWLEGPTPAEAGACRGPWADARWHACRDGKGGVVLRPAQPGLHPLASGLSACLARLGAIEQEGWEAIGRYAGEGDPHEVLRVVRGRLCEVAGRQGAESGVRLELHEAEVLLAFLFCLESARFGAVYGGGVEEARHEAQRRILRGMRHDGGDTRSPCRRGSHEQRSGEPSDALQSLSFVLARLAEAYGREVGEAHAVAGRVGKIRGAGNSIVSEVAKVFVETVIEYICEGSKP